MRKVLVVGAGNAALCAAIAAAENGAQVTVLERAPESARGGNSTFTGGCFRTVYDGADDIQRLGLTRLEELLPLVPFRDTSPNHGSAYGFACEGTKRWSQRPSCFRGLPGPGLGLTHRCKAPQALSI